MTCKEGGSFIVALTFIWKRNHNCFESLLRQKNFLRLQLFLWQSAPFLCFIIPVNWISKGFGLFVGGWDEKINTLINNENNCELEPITDAPRMEKSDIYLFSPSWGPCWTSFGPWPSVYSSACFSYKQIKRNRSSTTDLQTKCHYVLNHHNTTNYENACW